MSTLKHLETKALEFAVANKAYIKNAANASLQRAERESSIALCQAAHAHASYLSESTAWRERVRRAWGELFGSGARNEKDCMK